MEKVIQWKISKGRAKMGDYYGSRDLGLTQRKLEVIVRKNISAGKEYTLKTVEKEDGKKAVTRKQKIRCVAVYPYTVRFENRRGVRISLTFIDVYNMLQGRTLKI